MAKFKVGDKVRVIDGIILYKTKYEGYLVSECGKVYSLYTNKFRKFNFNNKGYAMVYINNRKKRYKKKCKCSSFSS